MKSKTLREDRTAAERKSAAVAPRRRRRIQQAGFSFILQINELPKVTSWESIHTNQYQIKLSQLSLYADKMYIHTSSLLLR